MLQTEEGSVIVVSGIYFLVHGATDGQILGATKGVTDK